MTAMSNDCISRQAAIDVAKAHWYKPDIVGAIEQLPSVQIDLTHIVFETLAECGIYGEEATVKFIGTLKRLGRSDLLPPCAR